MNTRNIERSQKCESDLVERLDHAEWTETMASTIAQMPSYETTSRLEELLSVSFAGYVPVKTVKENARTWRVKFDKDGARMKKGCTLLLIERNLVGDKHELNECFDPVSYRVKVARWKRLTSFKFVRVHPDQHKAVDVLARGLRLRARYINWSGRVPVIGTLWILLFKKESGQFCLAETVPSFDHDIRRFIKRY